MMLLAIIMAAAIMGSILVFGCIIQRNDYSEKEEEYESEKKLLEQMSNVRCDAHDIAVIENIFHSLIVWIKSDEKPHIQKD